MATWSERLYARWYVERPAWRDGTTEFHEMVRAALPRAPRILEVGAGASNPTTRFLAGLGEVSGADPDPAVLTNDALKVARVMDSERLPYADAAFSAVISNWVAEHVPDGLIHLQEIARVLEPGGACLFRTPNLHHYSTLASALLPHGAHRLLANRMRGLAPGAPDPFPTTYALNTATRIRRLAAEVGLAVVEIRHVEKQPSYCLGAVPLFVLGAAYERLVNATPALAPLRAALFVELRRT